MKEDQVLALALAAGSGALPLAGGASCCSAALPFAGAAGSPALPLAGGAAGAGALDASEWISTSEIGARTTPFFWACSIHRTRRSKLTGFAPTEATALP